MAALTARMLDLLPPARAAALTPGQRDRRPLGQRAGSAAPGAGLAAAARAGGRVALRADAGYFDGALARAARDERIVFAIGAGRIAPRRRLVDGIAGDAWHDAIDMHGAQVAVSDYCPDWWPVATRLQIRRVRLHPSQVSTDPRSRRRRTFNPAQRALPFPELAKADAIYAYSFILTSHDVSTPGRAVVVQRWYRHRATVENVFRDGKHGAALRQLPSGHIAVNKAWMWGALLAASMAGGCTSSPPPPAPPSWPVTAPAVAGP